MTTLLNVQNGTDSLSTTVAPEFDGKQRRIALQNFGHTHIFVYSSFSNKIILRWGSPMTCNEKIWTWRRREYACFFGETWYTWVWEWRREKQHHHRKKVAIQHISMYEDDNKRPQHAAAFDLANLFLCSHFLFLYPFRSLTLAAASPFNFRRTPMSSRRLPVSRLSERQEKNR